MSKIQYSNSFGRKGLQVILWWLWILHKSSCLSLTKEIITPLPKVSGMKPWWIIILKSNCKCTIIAGWLYFMNSFVILSRPQALLIFNLFKLFYISQTSKTQRVSILEENSENKFDCKPSRYLEVSALSLYESKYILEKFLDKALATVIGKTINVGRKRVTFRKLAVSFFSKIYPCLFLSKVERFHHLD